MSTQDQLNQIFGNLISRLQTGIAELPTIAGNEIVNYSLEAFEAQGWEGEAWEADKDKKKATGSILVKSGILKRSVRIISSSGNSVIVGSDVVYAPVHNFGMEITRQPRSETFERPRLQRGKNRGKFRKMTRPEKEAPPKRGFTVGAYSYRMPKRTFLAVTPELRARAQAACVAHLRKYLKPQ